MSETAFFVKDVIGPRGSVSIVMAETAGDVRSDDINAHTKTNQILRHYADMSKPDERIDMTDEPDHDALCEREQRFLLEAIDKNIDLTDHMEDAVKSLKIVLARSEERRVGKECRCRHTRCLSDWSSDVCSSDLHTKTNQILRHYADMSKPDERIDMTDEPDHDALCEREQRFLLEAIDKNIDLTDHMEDAVKSLKIVLA